ncbi:DUF2264 domain-containing protein [Paenibacillus alkalitolerans]|uniref:DUF2264 domain-containing protein n=1 Tax=Paenibacillus alkalitolerans TaxID=2799335 RepID=UPI0018F6075B|nr:DUF2264 domain-containing protein [Paenibacillus alkalitolerans]
MQNTRAYWLDTMLRTVHPVLLNLSERRLKAVMPVEAKSDDRVKYAYLEALARSLCGIAPWLESEGGSHEEQELRQYYADLSRKAIDAITDPESPDRADFDRSGSYIQTVVDAAFLASAIVRAPNRLWQSLDERVKANVIDALQKTRNIRPCDNNWILFSAMVEAALFVMGEPFDVVRVDYAVKQHMQWYAGDGAYGDGPDFHWDYYNSYVIHPMLIDLLRTVGHIYDGDPRMKSNIEEAVKRRALRYAEVQELMISPDGSFPPIGRSICYRMGAFHLLAQSALRRELPDRLSPAQVRCALTSVIRRCLHAEGTFDPQGWLKIGLYGSQPSLGEFYINTGSLYLCTLVYLPLGLPPEDPFWCEPDEPWTSVKVWSGHDLPADRALYG